MMGKLEFITELPEGERFVSMCEDKGVIYVCTETTVFKLEEQKPQGSILVPIEVVWGQVDYAKARVLADKAGEEVADRCYPGRDSIEWTQAFRKERDYQYRSMTRP